MTVPIPIKWILAKRVDCCCNQPKKLEECLVHTCPLWDYRMGGKPRQLDEGTLPMARPGMSQTGNQPVRTRLLDVDGLAEYIGNLHAYNFSIGHSAVYTVREDGSVDEIRPAASHAWISQHIVMPIRSPARPRIHCRRYRVSTPPARRAQTKASHRYHRLL